MEFFASTSLWPYVILVIIEVVQVRMDMLKFGAILSHPTEDGITVQIALDYINNHSSILPATTLDAQIEYVEDDLDKLKHIQKACHLMEKGVIAVVGPTSSSAVKVTQPIFSGLQVPQIVPTASDPTLSSSEWDYPYLVKMSPTDDHQSEALIQVIRTYGWTRIATLTSNTDYGRNGLVHFHKRAVSNRWIILSMGIFSVEQDLNKINATEQLLKIKNSGARVVVMNSEELPGWIVLGQAKALGMFTEGWAWLVTDAVGVRNSTLISHDGSRCPKITENMTAVYYAAIRKALMSHLSNYPYQNVSECIQLSSEFEGLIGTVMSNDDEQGVYQDFKNSWRSYFGPRSTPTVYARLLFDSILTIAYALNEYISNELQVKPPASAPVGLCSSSNSSPWENGPQFLKYITQVQGNGSSHYINFTSNQLTWWKKYDIINMHMNGWKKVSDWNEGDSGIHLNQRVLFPGRTYDIPQDLNFDIGNVHLRVTTILERPFTMQNEKTGAFFGFCIDLLKRLSEDLHFSYEISLVKDNTYGGLDPETMEWNGMVREVLHKEADVAIAPLFITEERAQYVEFTKPWYDLGLDILLPLEEPSTNLFDFFEPFDLPLWIAVIVSTYVCGFVVSACSFISPFGFKGKYIQRRRKHDHKYRDRKNELNANNGIWFAFSSLMRQGPSTTPISVSGRIVSGFWWLAVTILTATYTANLTAHLTVQRLDVGVSSLMELSKQTEIKYGTLNGTATDKFFRENRAEPYPRMFHFMEAYNTWMPNGSAAIERVKKSIDNKHDKYAFIYDSTILEYAARNEPCTSRTLGDIFRRVGYGIALSKKSPLTPKFDSVIMKLREKGEIEALESKWIQGPCEEWINTNAKEEQMTLWRMLGIFLVLAAGISFGLILLACEYIFAGYRDVVEDRLQGRQHKSWWSHVKRRLADTKDELQEMFCISPCCRRAYSLNESRRFSTHFLSFSQNSRKQTYSNNSRSRNGKSMLRNGNSRRRSSSFSSNQNGDVTFKKQHPIFNTHEHIIELCRAADIQINGDSSRGDSVSIDSEEILRDNVVPNGIVRTSMDCET